MTETAKDQTSVTLGLSRGADGAAPESYVITVAGDGAPAPIMVPASETSKKVEPLTPGTSYTFTAVAKASGIKDSPSSAPLTVETEAKPEPPKQLDKPVVTLTEGSLTEVGFKVRWTAIDGADTYTAGVREGTKGADQAMWLPDEDKLGGTVTGVDVPGTVCIVSVKASDSTGVRPDSETTEFSQATANAR